MAYFIPQFSGTKDQISRYVDVSIFDAPARYPTDPPAGAVTCLACKGEGLDEDDEYCPVCEGKGWVQ